MSSKSEREARADLAAQLRAEAAASSDANHAANLDLAAAMINNGADEVRVGDVRVQAPQQ